MSEELKIDRLSTQGFTLGPWRVKPSLNRISGLEQSRKISPRAMDTLVYMATRPGELVTREELINRVWRTCVTDNAVSRIICELRKALSVGDKGQAFIVTVNKRGYVLMASVECQAQGNASRRQSA